jgi:hypothetical protein
MKTIYYFLIAIFTGCFFSLNVTAQTGNWSDYTEEVTSVSDVYSITTPGQLAWIVKQIKPAVGEEPAVDFAGKTVVLAADIDLGAHNWIPSGGTELTYDKVPFNGKLDGGYHKIKNLHITGLNVPYVALIRNIGASGIVKNLILESGAVDGGTQHTGALAGYSMGKIENCANLGVAVIGVLGASTYYVGGIVSRVDGGGSVINSYNKASINSNRIGGIVGVLQNGTITGCFNTGALTGVGVVAGIVCYVGKSSAVISGCYHAGTTNYKSSGNAAIAALLYQNDITIRGCFGDKSIVNPEQPEKERPIWGMFGNTDWNRVTVEDSYIVTTAELQNSATLAILNEHSSNAYQADTNNENNGYPVIKRIETSVKNAYADNDNLSITRGNLGSLIISVKQPAQVVVHSVTGSLVRSLFVTDEDVLQLEKGMYIVNGKKIIL